MRIIAPMMILIMMTSTLAGCTSGDPDGGGNDEIDMETLQNLQNLLNNTNIAAEPVMNMFTVSWDREEILLGFDPENDLITLDEGYGGSDDNTLLYEIEYNGVIIQFRMSCLEYLYYSEFTQNSWADWLYDNHSDSMESNNSDNSSVTTMQGINDNPTDKGYTIWWWFNYGMSSDIDEICNFDGGGFTPTSRAILFEIDLDLGQAMSIQVIPLYVEVDLNCEDGYGTGYGNGTSTYYVGGQANCTVTGSTSGMWQLRADDWKYDENGSRIEVYNQNILDWYVYYSSIAPENFAVYFTMHDVVVYDLESE
jgi:hypothetical protein